MSEGIWGETNTQHFWPLCEELQELHEEPQTSDLGYSDDNVQRVWALVCPGAHMHEFALCDHTTF